MFDSLRGRRVTVMGLGRFGGGVGATRFLVEQGAKVTVTDVADESQLAGSLESIADLRLERLRLGGHDASDFDNADLIVASPAVPPQHPLLRGAKCPVTTEIGLFWARCRGRIVGVTGTVGKSTTAAMIHAILIANDRPAWLGGNIGGSLLGELDTITAHDFVVLELSSFQLESLAPLQPRAHVAVVTNFRPNHLDRHGTVEAYRAAKQLLLKWQTPEDAVVLPRDELDVCGWPSAARRRVGFGRRGDRSPEADRDWDESVTVAEGVLSFTRTAGGGTSVTLPLHRSAGPKGINAAAAAAAAFALDVSPANCVAAVDDFAGLPHRLEELGWLDGKLWVNDSKATTPEAAAAAIESVAGPIRLIAGGADKGVSLAPMIAEIRSRNVHVYLSGQTATIIAAGLVGHWSEVACFATFDESVRAARRNSQRGETVLLSPGCASWGQFPDYRARGDRFRELSAETDA